MLFCCENAPDLKVGEPIQFLCEMPQEISGAERARVLCRGRIARITEDEKSLRVAVAMYGYDFLEALPSAKPQ